MEENNSTVGNSKKRANSAEAESPVAKKKVATADKKSASSSSIDPLTPTKDPCSRRGKAKVSWVIYLAIREESDSKFDQCIDRCKSIAGSGPLAKRLQMDGTRHVTLWQGKMTPQEASKIGWDDDSEIDLPTPLQVDSWIPRGAYLKLTASTQNRLKELVSELEHLPKGGKTICDHLSLYRARGMNYSTFNKECGKIREGVPAKDWGTVQGVSVRLKVIGSDYSDCKVLAGV